MKGIPALTETDFLAVLRSLAQAQRRARRSVSEASLFVPVRALDDFSPAERAALADAALAFFDLDGGAAGGGAPPSQAAARHFPGGPEQGGGPVSGLAAALCTLDDLAAWAALLHEHWSGRTLCFHSSGSAGAPVRTRHQLAALAAEGAYLATVFATARRLVCVMPAHHIFGFMHSLWLAKFLAVPVTFAAPLPVAGFFGSLREGDVVMGFPFFWQSLLAVLRQGAFRLPPGVRGVTATGPCPDWVLAGLREKQTDGGPYLAGMQEIYGSTETNGIGIRRQGQEWYELYPVWDAVSLPDGTRRLARKTGNAADAGFGLAGGVEDCRETGTEAALPLPDVVVWHPADPRRFRPLRRTDAAVQVGGVNVYPETVAAVIRSHPLVRDCAVRLMRPEEGSRLKVFIVPACSLEEAAPRFGREFRAWLAGRLEPPCRPKRVRLGAALPANVMGKAADWE